MAKIFSRPSRPKQFFNDKIFAALLLIGIIAAVFSNTLASSAFIRDDRYIVIGNPLLQSWNSLSKLITTGYWEGAVGAEAPVQEFRPLLMLTYALTNLLFGFAPWMFHLTNLLLHAANSFLFFLLLSRRYPYAIALGGSALFAVLPVHVEAISYISGRSELLVSVFLLLTWLELERDKPRKFQGLFFFACALFCKEQAVLFPLVLAADDWVFHGRLFWREKRRILFVWLACLVLVYLAIRFLVLTNPFHGGSNYFYGIPYVTRLLTMSSFAVKHYTWPAITGLGLQSEFVRPLFPDANPKDFSAWILFAGWLTLFCVALVQLLRRRSRWSFWTLAGLVWILPVSNLIIHLDTIGAERFLYLPSLGLCILLSQFIFRNFSNKTALAGATLALLTVWYGILTFERNKIWATDLAYYEQAIYDNPLSAGPRSGMGVALLDEGKTEEAERSFRIAANLNPYYAPAYYNLGKIYYEKGDWNTSESWFKMAVARSPKSVDVWLFLGNIEEKRSNLPAAIEHYQKALSLQPWNILAHFNLGRLYMMQGRAAESREHFEEYLSLAPNDQEAPIVRQLLNDLKS